MGIAKSDKIISIPKVNARISFFIYNSIWQIYVVQGVRFELTYSWETGSWVPRIKPLSWFMRVWPCSATPAPWTLNSGLALLIFSNPRTMPKKLKLLLHYTKENMLCRLNTDNNWQQPADARASWCEHSFNGDLIKNNLGNFGKNGMIINRKSRTTTSS